MLWSENAVFMKISSLWMLNKLITSSRSSFNISLSVWHWARLCYSLHCSSVEMFRTTRQSLVLLLTRLSTDWWWWRLEKCAALANTALLLSRIVRCLSRKLRSPPCLVTSLVWIEERTPRLSISSNWQTQNGREKLWDVGGFRVMCESQGMFWRSQPALILTCHW